MAQGFDYPFSISPQVKFSGKREGCNMSLTSESPRVNLEYSISTGQSKDEVHTNSSRQERNPWHQTLSTQTRQPELRLIHDQPNQSTESIVPPFNPGLSNIWLPNLDQTNTRTNHFYSQERPLHRAKEPDKFDGISTDWRNYLVHFESVATWNRWTYNEMAQQLVMSLRGSAQKIISDLHPYQIGDYNALVAVLANRFNPAERISAYRCEFRNRRQQKHESAADFGYNLEKLFVGAYPTVSPDAREIYIIDQFIHGLIKP